MYLIKDGTSFYYLFSRYTNGFFINYLMTQLIKSTNDINFVKILDNHATQHNILLCGMIKSR